MTSFLEHRMRRLLKLLTLAALLCCWSSAAFTQTANPDSSEVMRQLLSLPAPTPRTAVTPTDIGPKKDRSIKFFDKKNPPANDAPIEDLLDYWAKRAGISGAPAPSDIVKQRLLDAYSDDLQTLSTFVSVLSYDESTAKKIKELFDKTLNDQLDENAREKVKQWLVFNSKYYLNDLYALASKVKDESGYVQNDSALVALARVDWQTAEPLLQALTEGSQWRSGALALSLLYNRAISAKDHDSEEKYRNRLKAISTDRNAPARARDISIEVLSLTEWPGRDDWYLALLADDSLRESSDGHYVFNPLTTLFSRDPDKWIPVMARLVESKDRAVQQAAANCLVNYATDHPRRDAILPVLRWLSEPDWLQISSSRRAWFMQTMDDLEIPESVPGLIWIVENEEDHRHWAASTLAHYKDPRAVPVLKKALAQSEEDTRKYILEGLLASGGISDSEAIIALEAYATKRMTPEGREDIDTYYRIEPLPLPLSIGRYLATIEEVPESLVRSVLARAGNLKKTNPTMAQSLLEIANQWQSREVDLAMIQRITNGTADANTIATALDRRTNMRNYLGAELQVMVQRTGEALGIGSVLLNEPNLAQGILTSDDQRAQIGLLAGARLTQTPLPVELVGALLPSKNPLLALAAERYLLAEDSKEARKRLWHHHPNQAFVTGWRENIQLIAGNNFDPMAKAEEKLRAELFKADGPLEIFALIMNGEQYSRVLRIYADKAVYTHYEDSARHVERVVSKAELAGFKEFVTTAGLKDLGPQFGNCHSDCFVSEFLALKKEEAWRVFRHSGISHGIDILAKFDLLGLGEGAKIRYALESELRGLELLYADENLTVKDVWQHGDEIRILVQREETEEEIDKRLNSAARDEENNEVTRAERWRKELAESKARFSWRKLTGKKAGDVVPQPDAYATFDESNFPDFLRYDDRQAQRLDADTIIFARSFDGLWKQVAGTKAVRIGNEDAAYANPVVTPDGKWVVVSRADTDWSLPNSIFRFNLKTGEELRVKLAPADELNPVKFLPFHNKILVRRAKDEDGISSGEPTGPDRPEYYLLDAATGDVQLVSGEFAPLNLEGKRFLQPTANVGQFWAAIPDQTKNQTQVGRYNLSDFSFKPVLVIPHITFDSMSMWVDESRDKLYFVYQNQLLSLPLKSAVK